MSATELRAHPRVPIVIPAKIFVPAESKVRPCMVTDLSAGGAGLQYDDAAPRPELVCLLTINGFGSFDGITVRNSGMVRGVRFLFGEAERHHLHENLIAFIKDGLSAVSELSSRERGPERMQLTLTRTNGELHHCDVHNISLQSVGLKTRVRPPIGELVKLARLYGRVAHHDESGIGIRFVSFVAGADLPVPPSA